MQIIYNDYINPYENTYETYMYVYTNTDNVDAIWTTWTKLCMKISIDPYKILNKRYPHKNKWLICLDNYIKSANSNYQIEIPNFEKMTCNRFYLKATQGHWLYNKLSSIDVEGLLQWLNNTDLLEVFDVSKIETRIIWRTVFIKNDFICVHYFEENERDGSTDEVRWINKLESLPTNKYQVYCYPINPLKYKDQLEPLNKYLINDLKSKSYLFHRGLPIKISVNEYQGMWTISEGWFIKMINQRAYLCMYQRQLTMPKQTELYITGDVDEISAAINEINFMPIVYDINRNEDYISILDCQKLMFMDKLRIGLNKFTKLRLNYYNIFTYVDNEEPIVIFMPI